MPVQILLRLVIEQTRAVYRNSNRNYGSQNYEESHRSYLLVCSLWNAIGIHWRQSVFRKSWKHWWSFISITSRLWNCSFYKCVDRLVSCFSGTFREHLKNESDLFQASSLLSNNILCHFVKRSIWWSRIRFLFRILLPAPNWGITHFIPHTNVQIDIITAGWG